MYSGKTSHGEIDFVAENGWGTLYVQAAESVRDPAALERELGPLRKIRDFYPKLILTLDQDPEADCDGIRRRYVLDWLMEAP